MFFFYYFPSVFIPHIVLCLLNGSVISVLKILIFLLLNHMYMCNSKHNVWQPFISVDVSKLICGIIE